VHMISRITHVHWRSRVRIHDPNWYNKHSLGKSAHVMAVAVRIARAERAQRAIITVREYMNGTWRHSRRERDARACGASSAQIVERGAKKGKKWRNLRGYMNGTCREHEARVW
jgi:hypothetical protein